MGTQGDVLGKRIAAFLLDGVLVTVAGFVVAFLAAAIGAAGGGQDGAFVALGFLYVLLPVLVLAYQIGFEAYFGRTIGKALLDLVVVKEDGGNMTVGAAIVRNLLRIIDYLPFLYVVGLILILVTDDSQRLGDIAASTLVVREGRGTVEEDW